MESSPNPHSVDRLSGQSVDWLQNYLQNSFCVLVDEVKASLGNLVKKLLLCICLVFLGLVE